MDPNDLSGLLEYSGIYFDPSTGMTYREDGSETGFTFERAYWTGPFGVHFTWPWLNPLGFATRSTTLKVADWAKRMLPKTLAVTIDEVNRISGPFTRTVERSIVVSDGSREEFYSAGWLANSIIRHGEKLAARYFHAEVRHTGFDLDGFKIDGV